MRLYNEMRYFDSMLNIIYSMLREILNDYRHILFSGGITESDFVSQIVFEYYKWFVIEGAKRQPVRRYSENPGDESSAEYRNNIYNLSKLIDRYKIDHERLNLPEGEYIERLQQKESEGNGRFEGYQVNKYDQMAVENCARNTTGRPIIALFKDGMIASSKRCSNRRINDAYRDHCMELKRISEGEDAEWLDAAIDIFHMEENLAVMQVYQLANFIVEKSLKIDEIDEMMVGMFINYVPAFDGRPVQNNLVCHNYKRLDAIFAGEQERELDFFRLRWMLEIKGGLLYELKNSGEFMNVVKEIPPKYIVRYLKGNYNLFEMINFPEDGNLDRRVIRAIRKIVGIMCKDIKPDVREKTSE